ncbi:MAG: HAD-IC family P-type ATPase [Phycisphaerales bacterium]|nr:HAD-IC family P-type ATPase [Phycisphaerales bacterium]
MRAGALWWKRGVQRGPPAGGEAGTPAWHAMDGEAVLAAVGSGRLGLSASEAAARLARLGRNELPRARPTPWWRIVLRQFASPLIVILGAAAGLSLAIGHATDAGFIAVVLMVNAVVGGSQEWRAERSAQALRRLLQFRASVEREGEVREVDASEVVVGDVVWLEPGWRVPADARLMNETGLETDESLLTGESMAVDKDATWRAGAGEAVTLADQRNMVHAGTTVVRGRGKAVVVATGSASSIGRLAIDVLAAAPGRPPLLDRLERFSRAIGVVAVGASVLVAVLGVSVHGHGVAEMAIFAVALAVSVIPEGLPIAITVALAVASTRMARRGVIVRRLGAVEGLGSCTLIASDKTGTLTCNELTVREVRLASGRQVMVGGQGYAPEGEISGDAGGLSEAEAAEMAELALAAALCNEADLHQRDGAWTWRGDPVDVALLSMAHKAGVVRERALDDHPEVNRVAFEPERRFAAGYHRFGEGVRVLVKGAPERVRGMCDGREAATLDRCMAMAQEMAAAGYRVLALAEGPAPAGLDASTTPPEPMGLRLLGLVGMIDPLRAGAREAIERCERAGVGTCMVTGDHPVTALAIARDLGMARDRSEVISGEALEAMSEAEVRRVMRPATGGGAAEVGRVRVFARVTPAQKLRIVKGARDAGHCVAVTGDGANDAPALKAANIGVAMGRGGTDVARDASDLVVSDDNFATIVAGVEEGRVAYDNIRKVIYLLLSTNGAEAVTIMSAVAMGLPLPLLPTQLLWLNLATEGFQVVSLALEPKERGVLARPPRPPRESIFNQLMVERLVIGSLVSGGVGLAAFWWMIRAGWSEEAARNVLLLLMVLLQNVEAGNARSETRSGLVIGPWVNPTLLGAAALAVVLQVAAMHWGPLQRALAIGPVNLETWLVCFGLSLTVFVAIELHKFSWWVRGRGVRVRGGRQ